MGGGWVTGEMLTRGEGGFEFDGFNQRLYGSKDGDGMLARYVVLDHSGVGSKLYSTHILEAAQTYGKTGGGLKYLGRSIHFAGSTPYSDSSCWFSPYFACSGGKFPICCRKHTPVERVNVCAFLNAVHRRL